MSTIAKFAASHTPIRPPSALVDDGGPPLLLVDRLAARVRRMLEVRDALETGRVLVVEPRTAALAQRLRSAGSGGEYTALLHARIPALRDIYQAFDRLVIYDWAQQESMVSAEQLRTYVGEYDVVVAHELLRGMPSARLPELVARLAALVSPRGFVVLSEPTPPILRPYLEAVLRAAGCVVAADSESAEEGWTYVLATGQRRSAEDLRLVGDIRNVTLADLQARPALLRSLVDAYRTVFGGDEWREWMRCTRPDCRRQYSRDEVAHLDPPGECECGHAGTLVAYHPEDAVRQQLESELGDPAASCCYLRLGDDGVEAFTWGYTASIPKLALGLAGPNSDEQRIAASLRRYLYACEGGGEGRIFRMAEGGVVREMRNPSLMWGLLQRLLQYAFDQGVQVVVGRTSPRTPMYTIFRGLGMQVIYRFSEEAPATDALPGGDDRVIVAGSVVELLRMITAESDRRLSLRIAHYLRAEREVG